MRAFQSLIFTQNLKFFTQARLQRLRSFSCLILRGNIYVVGGFDGVALTNTAEVFCPGRWSMISPMRMAKSGVKVMAMSSMQCIILVGLSAEVEEWRDIVQP